MVNTMWSKGLEMHALSMSSSWLQSNPIAQSFSVRLVHCSSAGERRARSVASASTGRQLPLHHPLPLARPLTSGEGAFETSAYGRAVNRGQASSYLRIRGLLSVWTVSWSIQSNPSGEGDIRIHSSANSYSEQVSASRRIVGGSRTTSSALPSSRSLPFPFPSLLSSSDRLHTLLLSLRTLSGGTPPCLFTPLLVNVRSWVASGGRPVESKSKMEAKKGN
ncbi:hypothetical protein DFH06DRAFT_336 [Mycena polygramma]|nr:hypothetical protein DFH06DRAFT_336 [Mycena polygramma]